MLHSSQVLITPIKTLSYKVQIRIIMSSRIIIKWCLHRYLVLIVTQIQITSNILKTQSFKTASIRVKKIRMTRIWVILTRTKTSEEIFLPKLLLKHLYNCKYKKTLIIYEQNTLNTTIIISLYIQNIAKYN